MKITIVKYGIYGLIIGGILFLLGILLGKGLSYSSQEVIGYSTIIASLLLIYFGIKHYRDKINNGLVNFWKGMSIGVLISVFVGAGIGIADYIYTSVINPDFAQEYLSGTLTTMEAKMAPEEFEVQKEILTQQMTDYGSSEFMALLMFVTVILIGFVISLISSLILQRK